MPAAARPLICAKEIKGYPAQDRPEAPRSRSCEIKGPQQSQFPPHSRRNYKLAMEQFIAWYHPAVQELETVGLITHRKQFGKKGQIRKICRLTRSGRERLRKWRIIAKSLILASASEFPLWRVDFAPTSITTKLLKKWSTAELTLPN